jgi:hypothetical protein
VGGFCAAGKCVALSASTETIVGVLVPTPAPSRRLSSPASSAPAPVWATPMTAPPGSEGKYDGSNNTTVGSTDDGRKPAPPVMAPGVGTTSDGSGPIGVSNFAPNGTTTVQGEGDDDTAVDDSVNGDPDDNTPEQEGSRGALPARLLALLAILCEALIASILFCYYRHWRRRVVLASEQATKNTTAITAAPGSGNGSP